MNIGIKYGIVVRPTVMKDGKIVREYPLEPNLILDAGLEKLATTFTCDCFVTAALGTGNTAPVVGNTKLETYVVSSETYKTAPVQQLGNYWNGDDFAVDPGVETTIKRWRTFVFPTETGAVTYKEAGWSWEAASVSDPDLFGRIVFANEIVLGSGEHLILYVELRTYIDSSSKTIASVPISGLTVAGHSQHEHTGTGFLEYDMINADGSSYHARCVSCNAADLEPVNSKNSSQTYPLTPGAAITISEDDTALGDEEMRVNRIPTPPQVLGYVQQEIEPEPYIASSYQRVYVFNALASDTGGGDVDLTGKWWDIRFGNNISWGTSGMRLRFDTVQSKTAANNVKLVFTKSWTRV